MKKRIFTLSAGIIEIAAALYIMLLGLSFIIPSAAFNQLVEDTFFIVFGSAFIIVGSIIVVIGIPYLIFGIKSIRYSVLEPSNYEAKRGAIIVALVFEFVFILLSVIMGMYQSVSGFLLIVAFCVIPIFKIIDLVKSKSGPKVGNNAASKIDEVKF